MSQFFDVLKYKVPVNNESYIFTIAYDVTALYKENQQNIITSITDALTNCKNRRFFEENYNSFVGHTAAVFDLDHFKIINDNEGHLVGDDILRNFYLFMKTKLTDMIHMIRLGGDEFVVVFQLGKSDKEISATLIQLRKEYEEKYKRFRYLSYSFGIGKLDVDLEASLLNIDKNMYIDKRRMKKI